MEKHSHLSKVISSYVLEKFGKDDSLNIQARMSEIPGVSKAHMGADWLNLAAGAAAAYLGLSKDMFMTSVGFSYIEQMLKRSPYQKHLLCLGNNFVEFTNNIDYIHSFIAHKSATEHHIPSMRCEDGIGGSMELIYISPKCCYNSNLISGMMQGISNLVFQAPITCQLREEKTILLHNDPNKHQMIEATYDLNLQAIQKEAEPLIVPAMLAERNKNSEHKISQSHVDSVNDEIAHILLTEGPEGHPLRRAAREKALLRWKKLGAVIRGAAFFKYLASKFQPIIPKHVEINARDFCSLMPFHIMIDKESMIVHAGLVIQRQVPALKNVGELLSTALTSVYPPNIQLTYDVLLSLRNTTFILSGEYHRKDRQSEFKGHFVIMNQPRRLMFIGSPYVKNVEECSEAGLKISQISEYDATREFIFLGGKDIIKRDLYGSENVNAAGSRAVPEGFSMTQNRMLPHIATSGGKDADELTRLREQLAESRAQLKDLAVRYRTLYLGMVPSSVVSNLKGHVGQGLLPNHITRMKSLLLDHEKLKHDSPIDQSSDARKANDFDVEKGEMDSLNIQPSLNERSISVDRGRLLQLQRETSDSSDCVYKPNYIEYEGVCMMFCDVVNFTNHRDMTRALDDLTTAYRWLSRLCQVFHLEIVESIGDAFLVIGDVTRQSRNQAARNMADFAIAFMILNRKDFPSLQLRMGIHHGRLNGGIVERSQKTFIVWGNDVEFTCKMESFGLPGKIQMSQQFFAYINDGSFNIEEREKVTLKGHGPATYLILLSSKVWSQEDLENIFGKALTL